MISILGNLFNIAKLLVAHNAGKVVDNADTIIHISKSVQPAVTKTTTDEMLEKFSPQKIKKEVFVYTPIKNIEDNWILILKALNAKGICDADMCTYVLSTIFVENTPFKPSSEIASKYSTSSGEKPYDFSKYVGRMGNTTSEMASRFRGSGLLQLTGYENYKHMDEKLQLDGGLVQSGYIAASEPHISAYVLAQYMYDREGRIRAAIKLDDYRSLRRIVNGGIMHVAEFTEAYKKFKAF